MTDAKKIEWLANELTDYIHNDRSDTPCDYYRYCSRKDCKYQYDFDGGAKCSDCLIENIAKFARPTLTEEERVILRNIDKSFIKIGKYDNTLMVFCTDGTHEEVYILKDNLFQFIKER